MNLNVEDQIVRSSFQPRPYQEPIIDVLFRQGCRRLVVVLPRRAGKDLTLLNCAIDQCLMKTCLVMYAGVNYGAVRKTLWDAIDSDGKKFLEYIPPRLIEKVNQSEMKITFVNGSILQFVGADSHHSSFRGTNPFGIVLSEYAYYDDPTVLDTVMPIVTANGGWVVLASTPQGKNTFYTLYKMAQELPDWWTYLRTVHETKHIPPEALEAERKRMSPELYAQEYLCSFDRGISGSIWGTALNSLRINGHITSVTWEPGLLVHTAWDIGLSTGNETTIIFFQVVGDGTVIRIIDCYSSSQLGLDAYAAIVQSKPYRFGVHLGPHDLSVREWGAGAITRYEKARNLDIEFTVLPQVLLSDQVENALTHFPKVWIDSVKCKSLIDALENYYREWDEQRQVYKRNPVHNWACFVANTFVLTKNGTKKIIDVQKDDQILTLYGWKKCNKAQLMKQKAALVEVIFQDGTRVKCTPEHKFLTEKGWISAENLTKDILIRSSLMQSPNTSTEKCIEYSHHKNISVKAAPYFIEMFGLMPLAKYLLTRIYIILIQTISTITYGIYFVCQKMSTGRYPDRTIKDSVKQPKMVLENGINQKQQYYGEKEMLNDKLNGWFGKENLETVKAAKRNSIASSDQMECSKGFVEIPVDYQPITNEKELRIEKVNLLSELADVYCINVPEAAHFSLENGAIVHNSNYSSAFMAIFIGLHHTAAGKSGAEYDRIRNEALYGKNNNLPRVFQKGLRDQGF